jgi:hypothetical protein
MMALGLRGRQLAELLYIHARAGTGMREHENGRCLGIQG